MIRVENLGKRYRLGQLEPYKTLRDAIAKAVRAPFRSTSPVLSGDVSPAPNPDGDDHLWALRNVSFEVMEGEVVGIIGRNGAGKTTLLKILSRITEPTEGRAEIRGRVGSLLEVGTGFHPELTGRENVYFNGAVLGMRKAEIDRKFDEIVAFAELQKFMDTPVKRYSSGMYVRLAFAVAAHLEPEILLVDEVLAVGDIAFQRKCLGKMGDVAQAGRTVLFVSHQMNSIRKLCEKCIWLDAGHIRSVGSTRKVVSAYEVASSEPAFDDGHRARGTRVPARFLEWEIIEPEADERNYLTTLGRVRFRMVVQVNRPIRDGVHGIALRNSDNILIWGWAEYHLKFQPGTHNFEYSLPSLPLCPGVYSWHVTLYDEGELLDAWQAVPDLLVATEPLTHPRDEWSGILNVPCEFQTQYLGDVPNERELGIRREAVSRDK